MILIVKSRPMCHKQLGVERTSLPYGFFDCWTRSGGGENALINTGFYKPFFKDSELSNPSNYHICSASTNSNPSSSINVCKPGLRSIIR